MVPPVIPATLGGVPAPVVKPELGPTLPALLRGPWRRAGRRTRRALIVVAVAGVVLALAAITALRISRGLTSVVRTGPPAINLAYPDDRLGVAPRARGEVLRLRTLPGIAGPETLTVRDGGPAPPRRLGDPVAQLALRFAPLEREVASLPGFAVRSEGRVRVNEASGWQLRFQYLEAGRTFYGVRMLLTPDEPVPGQRSAEVDVRAARSPVTPNAASAGANGPMKTALLSLRFGLERP